MTSKNIADQNRQKFIESCVREARKVVAECDAEILTMSEVERAKLRPHWDAVKAEVERRADAGEVLNGSLVDQWAQEAAKAAGVA